MPTFRVATFNVRHGLPADKHRADVRRLMGQADLIALQEQGGRRGILESLAATHKFGMLMLDIDDVTGESATPILWRDSLFTLRRPDFIQASEREVVPKAAAGPTKMPPKFITVAHLIHRETGRTVHVFNGHWFASQHIPKMRELADQMTTRLTDRLLGVEGPTLVVGDMNNTRPMTLANGALVRAGLSDVFGTEDPKRATKGKRDIDRILYRSPVLRCTDVDVLTGYASDHRPLVATFELTPKVTAPPQHACPTCGLLHEAPA